MFKLNHIRVGLSLGLALCLVPVGFASAKGSNDPTRPPASMAMTPDAEAPDETKPLDLSAIFFAEDRRVAIINGRRMHEQDTIEGARILEIAPSAVRVLRNELATRIELAPQNIKGSRTAPNESNPSPAAPMASPRVPGREPVGDAQGKVRTQ